MRKRMTGIIVLLLVCLISMCACSSGTNENTGATATSNPAVTKDPNVTDVPTATPEPAEAATEIPEATFTEDPAATEVPTATPEPTATEAPTATPEPTATEAPVSTPEPIEAEGNPAQEIVDNIILGWNLGNTFDSFSGANFGAGSLSTETSWGNPATTEELFDLLAEQGINAVRIPVTWYNHMDSSYNIDEKWMNRVQEVVDYAFTRGFYVIINMHHDTGTDGWLKASSTDLEWKEQVFVRCWEQIAERFKDYDNKLLFEGFNEILNDSNEWVNPDNTACEVVNELNQLFVDTVRAAGGNNATRVLICNTYAASSAQKPINNFKLPNDTITNSLIVETHIYTPYQFTATEYPAVKTWSKNDVSTAIKAVYNKFTANGIPTIIGEFGCVDKSNEQERVEWTKYYVETATSLGIKCFWWDNGSEFAIINRRSNVVKQKNILGVMVAAAYKDEFTPVYDSQESDNLCEDIGKWTGWIDTANGGNAIQEYLKNGIALTVEGTGTEEWHVQGSYSGVTLEVGATYEIEFDYVGTKDINITLIVQKNCDDYEVYHSENVSVNGEIQHFKGTFTMEKDIDKQVSITFNCGNREAYVPFTVIFTNLSMKKVG